MELQLRHLRSLCVLARTGSLNRTATALGLPQPALSRQVRRIENLLGGPLFERDSSGTRPTALGAEVVEQADAIVALFDELGEQVRTHRLTRSRTLRVGWATSAFHEALLRGLDSLSIRAERPYVVMASSSHELIQSLRTGDIDIALIDRDESDIPRWGEGVTEITWARSPVLVSFAADHPLTQVPTLTMRQLAEERWICSSGPDGCMDVLRDLCGGYGFEPRISHDIAVTGPRGDVVRHQHCVSLSQAVRSMGPGVVRRAVADLPQYAHHCLAFRTTGPIVDEVPLLAGALARAHREVMGSLPYLPARFGPRPRSGTTLVPSPGASRASAPASGASRAPAPGATLTAPGPSVVPGPAADLLRLLR
ncbi:LysR family transcriptional regulator [Streptomyces sp. NPDC003023]|uniref:LysR family transcriptional regulator n=1 Tax=Streptomyces sp. NPDC003023 TaxID=3364675 RepID=UPI00367BCD60